MELKTQAKNNMYNCRTTKTKWRFCWNWFPFYSMSLVEFNQLMITLMSNKTKVFGWKTVWTFLIIDCTMIGIKNLFNRNIVFSNLYFMFSTLVMLTFCLAKTYSIFLPDKMLFKFMVSLIFHIFAFLINPDFS